MHRCLRAGLFGCAIVIAGLPARAFCETAPPQLSGKSLSVAWTEARVQRTVGTADWRNVSESYKMEMYYSASRTRFGRFSSNLMRKPIELVGASTAKFRGRTMTFYYRGAANTRTRQFLVNFDQAFSSCDAKVISGKPRGADTFLMATQGSNQMLEAKSITVASTLCAVRAGNIFAQ